MLTFLSGFTYPVRGLAFALRHRALLRYFPAPFLLGLLILGLELGALLYAIPRYFGERGTLALVGIWLAGLLAALLVFLALQGVLAAPFCERLSERTEALATSRAVVAASLSAQVASTLQAAVRALAYLALAGPLLVVGLFVPGFGLVTLVLASVYAALDFLDYPSTRRSYTFRRKLALLRRHPAATLGFGLAASLLAAIPVVGLLTAPAAAVGATLLFLDLEGKTR